MAAVVDADGIFASGLASGFWMLAPDPVAYNMGRWPMKLVIAVISSGRNRSSQPLRTVSATLQLFFADRRAGSFGTHTREIAPLRPMPQP